MVGQATFFKPVRIFYAFPASLFFSSWARTSNIVDAKNRTLGRTVVAERLNMPETIAMTRNRGNNFSMIVRIFICKIEFNDHVKYTG